MNVEITIDEVVLRGVPPEDAHAVLAVLQKTLGEQAAEWARRGGSDGGLVERAETSRRLAAVNAPDGSPEHLGQAVAGAVWSSLAGEGGGPR